MNYVTVGKLQTKLDGEANQSTVKKLIDRMVYDGLVESKSNKRLGISYKPQSESTQLSP